MSKTSQNTVNILDVPEDMYGKLMSMKDDLIEHYFELCTDIPMKEVEGLPPRDAKAKLAREIVRVYHGDKEADKAEEEFERVFRQKQAPSDVPKLNRDKEMSAVDLLVQANLASSKAEARRLIEQKGVRADGRVVQDPAELIRPGARLQVGKRRFMDT